MAQRLVMQMFFGLGGGFACGARVAGAGRDHAARQRSETSRPAARLRGQRHQGRQFEDEADDRPDDIEENRSDEEKAEADADAGFDALAEPCDGDLARLIDDPGNAQPDCGEQGKKNEDPDHEFPGKFAAAVCRDAAEGGGFR